MTFEEWQLDRIYKRNSCLVQLHLPGRGWTNVSPLFNDWDVCRITTYLCYGQLGTSFYLRESLCRREEVLSAPRISSFWKRSVSLSLLDVFLLVVFGLCLCFGVCFVSAFGRHLAFCISPVLSQPENSWPTTRRFDDRPSLERARHELKKKIIVSPFHLLSLRLFI